MLSSLLLALTLPGSPQASAALPAPLATSEEAVSTELPAGPERLLIYGGRIYLGNENGGVVEALLIEDGRVVSAGPLPELAVELDEPGLGKIDLKGGIAVPGLQDAHGHVEYMAAMAKAIDLRGTESYAELISRVVEVADESEAGTWLIGWGWDQDLWEERDFPTHGALSEAVPGHPVLLHRIDRDVTLVNEVVLDLAELSEVLDVLPTTPGGRMLLDQEDLATGIFMGNAQGLVHSLVPATDAEVLEQELLAAQEELLALGLTCVHDMRARREVIDAYVSLRDRGLLKLRIVAYLDGNRGLGEEQLQGLPMAPDAEDQLSVHGVAFALDGSLGSWSAALLRDYSDRPRVRGDMWVSEPELMLSMDTARQAGLQPALRAVGDAANRMALDTIQRMLEIDKDFMRLRPRIEQALVISTKDLPRFPELGVSPSMQPTRSVGQMDLLTRRLGPHRSRGAHAWRSLAPAWMALAFGSGFPDSEASPLLGMYAARTHQPDQILGSGDELGAKSLDGFDALAGFTRGASWAAHQEDRRGQLLPGFWADLTVFDIDPVEGNPELMPVGEVQMTIINGRVVYQR